MKDLIDTLKKNIEPFQGSDVRVFQLLRFHRRLFRFKSIGLMLHENPEGIQFE